MKKKIQVAIDSPAAAGAGTQAKLIAKHYNLFYLDTGKIYRFIGNLKLQKKSRFNYSLVKKKISKLKINNLNDKTLLSDKVAIEASIIAKDQKIRKIVHNFQIQCAYKPPNKFNGSILEFLCKYDTGNTKWHPISLVKKDDPHSVANYIMQNDLGEAANSIYRRWARLFLRTV